MNHTSFITHMASIYSPNVYLELGLYQGETIKSVSAYTKVSIGVDCIPVELPSNISFYCMTTDEFFQSNIDYRVDMAFIDADHTYKAVKTDLENVLNILNPGGIVFLHDTDPEENWLINPGYCGDCYKLIKELETDSRINIITYPIAEAGVSVITLKNDTRCSRRNL